MVFPCSLYRGHQAGGPFGPCARLLKTLLPGRGSGQRHALTFVHPFTLKVAVQLPTGCEQSRFMLNMDLKSNNSGKTHKVGPAYPARIAAGLQGVLKQTTPQAQALSICHVSRPPLPGLNLTSRRPSHWYLALRDLVTGLTRCKPELDTWTDTACCVCETRTWHLG